MARAKKRTDLDPAERIERLERQLAEARKTGRELHASRRILQLVMNNMSSVCFVKDANGRYLMINRQAEETIGMKNEEVRGKTPFDIFPKEFAENIEGEDQTVLSSGKPLTTEVHLRYGENRIFLQTKVPLLDDDGSILGVCSLATEITAQKHQEDRLREREETVTAILNASVEPMMLLDTQGTVLRLNDTAAMQYDMPVDELVGKSIFELLPAAVAKSRKNYHEIALQWSMPVRFEEARGGMVFDTTVQPDFDEHGNIARLAVFARDITLQKKATTELKEREERYSKLFNSLLDAAFLINADTGIIREANRQAETLLGVPREEIAGMHHTEIHPQEMLDFYQRQFDEHVESGRMENVEAEIITPAGDRIPVLMSSQLLVVSGREHLLTICRDLTLFKLMAEKQSRATDSESVATVMAEVAHNLNNVLTIMHGYCQMIREKAGEVAELKGLFKKLKKAEKEADELIRQLQQIAANERPQRTPVQISGFLVDCARSAFHGSPAKCDIHLNKELKEVLVDKAQVCHALKNLVVYVEKASSAEGPIRLRAENTEVTKTDPLPVAEGAYVRIAIEYSGSGLSEREIAGDLEPHPAKSEHTGGLGLATANSLIRRNGGHIALEGGKEGTMSLVVYLPAAT